MTERVLITGGAGFIGSHLADELLRAGYQVRALDNLTPQVHGPEQRRPDYLDPEVELQVGDVRDPAAVERALGGVDYVVHLAAAVGVGQSMYAIADYTSTNNLGTAVLLEQLLKYRKSASVQKLLVASSMSIYGEGLYLTRDGKILPGHQRTLSQLRAGRWELYDQSGGIMLPLPTPETKQPTLSSVYALSKYDQEQLCLMFGRTYDLPTVALRFFNVFGTRQSLSNPYTGVLAIFISRLLNNHPPLIFEDGRQQRDLVSVHDVARACRLALENREADGAVFNIGSGNSYTIRDIARRVAVVLGKDDIEPEITGKYRAGDIRHCYADTSLAREVLGYEPQVTLEDGLEDLTEWVEDQRPIDRVDQASAELATRGLTV